ncbi:MAG TPA: twin-arginine translocation signal domain-containing protein [Beijerinckiaceae bacterium]|jgi:LPS-assembly lipoprotein
MSSSDFSRRGFLRLSLAGAAALPLGACLRPLYGPTASGKSLPAELAAIEIVRVKTKINQEYTGHALRQELMFQLDGSGTPSPKRYRLAIDLSQSVLTQIVNAATGRADSATIFADADYTLRTIDGDREIASGKASGSAVYDRSIQRFASVRAARDAETRVGKLLAEQIRTRLALALATS